jgi:hypothetical protein
MNIDPEQQWTPRVFFVEEAHLNEHEELHGYQVVTATDGFYFNIPPIEYTLRPGDQIVLWVEGEEGYDDNIIKAVSINAKPPFLCPPMPRVTGR